MSAGVERLRAIAEAAMASCPPTVPEWHSARSLVGDGKTPEDAELIEAMSPDAVLALLDRLREAEAAVERVRALADWCAAKEADMAGSWRTDGAQYAEGARDAYDVVEARIRAALTGQRGPEGAQEGAQEAAGGRVGSEDVQGGNGAQTGAEGFEGDA